MFYHLLKEDIKTNWLEPALPNYEQKKEEINMQIDSYFSQRPEHVANKMTGVLEGKNVIVVEDIIDSGRTLSYLLENLQTRKPKTLRLCTLLDKPERRVTQVNVDYVGFVIPDEFVVGYGLDYDQKYRNLPYIGYVEIEEE